MWKTFLTLIVALAVLTLQITWAICIWTVRATMWLLGYRKVKQQQNKRAVKYTTEDMTQRVRFQ